MSATTYPGPALYPSAILTPTTYQPEVTVLPVAGQPYAATYYPTLNGQPVDVSSVDRIDVYATAARTGTPVLVIAGPATRVAVGQYVFPAALMPAAGLYPTVVTFTTGATVRTDSNDTLQVYDFDGTVGLLHSPPVLVSLTDARRILRGQADSADTDDLLLFLRATDKLVIEIMGSLPAVIPPTWHLAARIIFEHLWDHWQGAVPTEYEAGSDTDVVMAGFAIPRAARELLLPPKPLTARGPSFSFPEPTYLWPGL